MKIPQKELERLVKTELHKGMALSRLHRHFCKKMNIRGMCTYDGECSGCEVYLNNIFNRITDKADDPYAVLVWAIRNELADMVEESKEAETAVDWLGQEVETNPFDMLLDEL